MLLDVEDEPAWHTAENEDENAGELSLMKIDSSKAGSEAAEKSLVRTRGSSSPFRCIGNLVQQMNTEKDEELSLAKLRLQELESVASSRKKEICMLNTRLATAESMTHDVIRDLLGVKLDMTKYAVITVLGRNAWIGWPLL